MSSKYKDQILKLYKQSYKEHCEDIKIKLLNYIDEKELQLIFPTYEHVIKSAVELVSSRWEQNLKYVRTEFVKSAFRQYYPEEVFRLSIAIDVQINILDDLYDEVLEKNIKAMFIHEILKELRNHYMQLNSLPDEISNKILGQLDEYYLDLDVLAFAEPIYMTQIIDGKLGDNEILEISKKLLYFRSQDINIFNDLAMIASGIENSVCLTNAANYYRSVNLLKKDIFDIEHDKIQNQMTPVVYMFDRDREKFEYFVFEITKSFKNQIHEQFQKEASDKGKFVIKNYEDLLKHDYLEIKTYLSKIG